MNPSEQVQNFNEDNEEYVGHEPEEQEASLNNVLDWLKDRTTATSTVSTEGNGGL